MFKDKGREITQEDIYNECYPPIDSNKLIAEFMGFPTQTDVIDDRTLAYYIGDVINANNENNENDDNVFHPDDMQFHTSWDWLMPVVHDCTKIIENYGYDSNARIYFEDEIFNLDNTLSEFLNNDIESVYARVVEFIKYYNKNN